MHVVNTAMQLDGLLEQRHLRAPICDVDFLVRYAFQGAGVEIADDDLSSLIKAYLGGREADT